MNAETMNPSTSKPAITMVEEVGDLVPAPAPPKRNKRKNHRGGRKTKKKQSLSTEQDARTASNNVAVTSIVEATVPTSATKQKQVKRKRQKKSGRAPTEVVIAATDTIIERQDDGAIRVIEDECGSPTAQDDPTSACHRSTNTSTQDLSRYCNVDEATGTRAETAEVITAMELELVSMKEGASGDIPACGGDGLGSGLESVNTTTETSKGKC